jgi:hypothetical protein
VAEALIIGSVLGGITWIVRSVMKNRKDLNHAFYLLRDLKGDKNGKRGNGCKQQETMDKQDSLD